MILVTGGTGLVGSHLLYQLSLENDVIIATHRKSSNFNAVKRVFGYYNDTPDFLFDKIIWKEADINDISALEDVFQNTFTQVYHCAALVSFNPKDYQKLRSINIKGTANLVNLSIKNSIEKFCFVSSIAAIGKSINGTAITEETEWNPEEKHHGYAITKYGAEMEVWRASQEGLNVIIVNPGVILGAGFWTTGSGKLFHTVFNGFNYYTKGITGFIGVEDVINNMITLMKSNITNERFILVAENKSFKSILSDIAQGLGVKRPSVKVSKIMSEFAWRLSWLRSFITGKEPLLTKHSARSGHHKNEYSSNKVKGVLSYNYKSINTVINKICALYLKEHN